MSRLPEGNLMAKDDKAADRTDAAPDEKPETVEISAEEYAELTAVPPEWSQLQNQPHGQAGQAANRPAHEGHQGHTPIQPASQIRGHRSKHGESPTEAVTHAMPGEVVATAYAGVATGEPDPAGTADAKSVPAAKTDAASTSAKAPATDSK